MTIETVNLHIWGKCNLACVYCYGTFPGRPQALRGSAWCRIIDLLADARVRRVSFSGGEPSLHPDLRQMLTHARARGLQTSIITNGARVDDAMLAAIDMVGLTVDAVRPAVLERLGRGEDYLSGAVRLAQRCGAAGVRVKINTVVTSINAGEDLTELLLRLRPVKWKPMQFVHVHGENDATAPELEVSRDTFADFVQRHGDVRREGVWVEPESSETIRATYVMIDPLGRVFQHAPTGHRLSAPVLDVGLIQAIDEAGGYDRGLFLQRGGDVDVRRLPMIQGTR